MDNITTEYWSIDQLTEEQAIELGKSGLCNTWTDEQMVRSQLFQRRWFLPTVDRFLDALTRVLGRSVFYHELATEGRVLLAKEYLGEKPRPTLEEIMNLIPADKRILIGF